MNTDVMTSNLVYTLDDIRFEAALRLVLAEKPDAVALQEVGPNRNHILTRVGNELGYEWARPAGGEPIMWRIARYGRHPMLVRGNRLARAEFVGHIPGRKDRLPESIASEVHLRDSHQLDAVVAIIDYHLTAEVQFGKRYRRDPVHLLRVLRHRRERARLGHRARVVAADPDIHQVHPAGDSNFDGFTLRGFVSCWKDRAGGTLGPRAVDVIFGAVRAPHVRVIKTPSDHDTVIATYP